MIEINENQLNIISERLHGIPKGAERAFAGAINRALITYRSESVKEIRRTYNINAGDIKNSSRTPIKRAVISRLDGSVSFAGTVIPLIRFNAKAGRPVTVSVLKTTGAKRLKNAYFANLGHGSGIFERLTRERDSSKQLFGPSAAQMAYNEDVMDPAQEKAQKTLVKRFDHEVSRILNGYGSGG